MSKLILCFNTPNFSSSHLFTIPYSPSVVLFLKRVAKKQSLVLFNRADDPELVVITEEQPVPFVGSICLESVW